MFILISVILKSMAMKYPEISFSALELEKMETTYFVGNDICGYSYGHIHDQCIEDIDIRGLTNMKK